MAVNPPAPRRLTKSIMESLRASVPSLAEVSIATGSALLLVLAFPDFDLWPLAWIAFAPLLVVVAVSERPARVFLLGWLWGAIFFYGSCWWLTYPMIHYASIPSYGHIPAWLAYALLLLPVLLVALFPALFCLLLAQVIARLGIAGILISPFVWITLELARYAITGEAWNALGYSQAFHPSLIHSARWGGFYAVSFLIVTTNAAFAFALLRRTVLAATCSAVILVTVLLALVITHLQTISEPEFSRGPGNLIVAVQPNVPMAGSDDPVTMQELLNRHLQLSVKGLSEERNSHPDSSLVIWPESPMNFSYWRDSHLRDVIGSFARNHHTSVLLNSLEPAPGGGEYNSAILINEEGQKVAQYDKIRLMPFGEYVPLPRWLPGASSVRGIVGEFTPGSSFTLMPLGGLRVGVFICIEAAHPSIARRFANEGADGFVNISNDGYLGPTAVMRQHLANAVFRAVENDRPLLRVTNSGISASIDSKGRIWSPTHAFETAVRAWDVDRETNARTFYSRHGDVFVYVCALISLGFISASFMTRRMRIGRSVNRRG